MLNLHRFPGEGGPPTVSGKEDLGLRLWVGSSSLLLLAFPHLSFSICLFQSTVGKWCQGFVILDSICLGFKELIIYGEV